LHRNEAESNDTLKDAKSKAKDYYNICKSRANSVNSLLDAANKLIILNKDKVFLNYQESQLINEKRKIEIDLRDYNARKLEIDEQMQNVLGQIDGLKKEARSLLDQASKIIGVPLVNNSLQLTEDHKTKLKALSDSTAEISASILQAEAIGE